MVFDHFSRLSNSSKKKFVLIKEQFNEGFFAYTINTKQQWKKTEFFESVTLNKTGNLKILEKVVA